MTTWVDWVIILFVAFGLFQGFWRGFIAQAFQIGALVLTVLVTFALFPRLGGWLESQLHVSGDYAQPISLAILFFVLLFVIQFIANVLQKLFAPMLTANPLNRVTGMGLGVARQLLTASIILALLVTFPTPAELKEPITGSRLAKPLISFALGLDRLLGKSVHQGGGSSLGFKMIDPESKDTKPLNFTEPNPTIDLEGELKMLALTTAIRNNEKKSVLTPSLKLQEVARNHAKDMLAKNYFGHISPEGKSVADRVQGAEVTVVMVGENLAHAPTVDLAQAGLLASPGHRKNILSEDYNQVGIAVLDAKSHGKMVVQVFAKSL